MSRTRLCLAILATALLRSQADAQTLEGSASVSPVQSHTRFANATIEQTGPWLAADGAVRFGRWRLGAGVAMGSLASGDSDEVLHPSRDARVTSIVAQGYVRPWAAAGLSAEARRFDTEVGPTVWRLIGANVLATPALGDKLEGLADVTFWPAATVIDGQAITFAFRTVFGAQYRVSPLVSLRLAYRFERFDFEAAQNGDARLEQFRGLTLGGVLRLTR